MGETQSLSSRREQTCMSGSPTQKSGVAIMDLAPDQMFAPGTIFAAKFATGFSLKNISQFGRRYQVSDLLRRIEPGMLEFQRLDDFMSGELT
jgi:hypothetical protein